MLKWQKNFFTKPDGLLKIKILFIKKFVWLLLNFPYYYLYLCMAWTSLPISFFSSLFFFPIFLKKRKRKEKESILFSMERHAKQRSKPRSARRSAAKRAKVTQHPSSKGIAKPPLPKGPLMRQNSIRAATAAASSSRRSSSTTTASSSGSGPNSRKNSRLPENNNTPATDQNSDTGENNTELLRNEVITELIHQVVTTSI